MKRFTCILLLATIVWLQVAPRVWADTDSTATYEEGYIEGEVAAQDQYSGGGWFAAGLGGGVLLGLIGGGIVVGLSQSGTVSPPSSKMLLMQDRPVQFKAGFLDGYSKRGKKKRLAPAILGSLLGTVVIVAIIVSNE